MAVAFAREGPRFAWQVGCVLILLIADVISYEESYTISQLSPKSASGEEFLEEEPALETSLREEVVRIEPSIHLYSSINYDDTEEIVTKDIITEDENEVPHMIVARSVEPILGDRSERSINIEDSAAKANINDIESNDVEIHNKRKYYDRIHPTKTISYHRGRNEDNIIVSSESHGDRLNFRYSGEANGVPRARALPLPGPQIRPTVVQPTFATASPRYDHMGRQNNGDIQNIITGIVKLLNGNVNVQANTQLLRPGRPMATRINNRGPPRISEVQPLPPDFDKPLTPPSFHPTKFPPPYPFDRPPHHAVNLPEQIVPPLSTPPYRPGYHRPNIPPWQRQRPRPNPNRRPPNMPMYKPTVPPMPHGIPSMDLPEDILNFKPTEDEDDEEEENNHAEPEEDDLSHTLNNIHLSDNTKPTPEIKYEVDNSSTVNDLDQPISNISNNTETDSTSVESILTTLQSQDSETTSKSTVTTSTSTEIITERPTTTSTTTEKPKTEKPIKLEGLKDSNKKKEATYSTEKDKLKNKPEKNINESEKIIPNTNASENFTAINNTGEDVNIVVESSMSEKPLTSTEPPISTPVEGLPSHSTPKIDIFANLSSNTVQSSINTQPTSTPQNFPYLPYRPRPGIVLDDPDFKPHASRPPLHADVITADTRHTPGYGEIFDVTVSAIQGPGGKKGGPTVHIENVNPLIGHARPDDIIVSASGEHGFVSIDGKRTYLNLFGESSSVAAPVEIRPTQVQRLPQPTAVTGSGVAVPVEEAPHPPAPRPSPPQPPRSQPPRRPQPTVRIDTCIVGDDSTCDQTQNEKCKTEAGISSCQCRPGFARRNHRDPCRRVVAMLLSLRVDRLYERKIAWDRKLSDKESEPYQQLSFEALRAIDSAFSMTPFSDDFVSSAVNGVYRGDDGGQVFVNYTVLVQESAETLRSAVASDIQRHLLGVIRRRSNNVGASALWVDTPAGSVSRLEDVDECSSFELNDCHQLATCTNTWGGFRCACPDTTRDAFAGQLNRGGRECVSCPTSHCSNRGTCLYSNNQPYCSCSSGYYGSVCEVDGEVVGVAVGASLAALLVIALTLVCLLAWSRKWSREQKAAGMGSPVFSYMANTVKTPPVGQPPYQVSLEERMRWAQLAEAMAQANHYAQPEPSQAMVTRPSSAMFGGYPTLPPVPLPRMGLHMGSTLHHTGTMNTVASRANTAASQGNLYGYAAHAPSESTSSEASSHVQERADLLVPRPKSRTARSMHNQTGIYYDVEYENAPEAIYGSKGIPLSTYAMSRGPPFYRA